MPEPYQILEFDPAYEEEVRSLARSILHEELRLDNDPAVDEDLQDLKQAYASPGSRLVIALSQGKVVATGAIRRLSNADCELTRLFVRSDRRRQGLATLLYSARRDLIRRMNLRGHVASGMLKGYGAVKAQMSVEDYVAAVVAGRIFDPTLSIQLKRGFTVHGIIYDYVDDPSCDNKAAFIVWHNPDYQGR